MALASLDLLFALFVAVQIRYLFGGDAGLRLTGLSYAEYARRGFFELVWVTALGSAAVLAALVQTPGVSHFFGCVPLGPVAWAGVALAITLSALAPRLERLAAVHRLYDLATRLTLRLADSARHTRHLLHTGIARPVA